MLLDLMNTWKAFYASCCLWKCIPCKKLLRCLSKWYSQLVKSQVNMADEAKLHSPIHSTLEAVFVRCAVGHCHEENWALSVDQCQLQTLKFSVHLIDLLSILLRGSGFTRKAVVDHTSSRPPNSDHDLFLCKFGFGKCFRASSKSNH